MISDLSLMKIQVGTLFVHDDDGRHEGYPFHK